MVNEVRALPAKHVFCSFCEHSFESHGSNELSDFVRVDEGRVAEDCGFFSEESLHFGAKTLHFVAEGFGIFE